MPRAYFSNTSRLNYFSSLKELSRLSWSSLARKLGISHRHLRDIRQGVYSLNNAIAETIKNEFNLDLPKNIVFKKDYWHTPKAAKLGGKRHFELYGPPPATKASRSKGGLNSLRAHKLNNTGFITAKTIVYALKNTNLAEIIGAFMGDGGLALRQAKVTLSLKTDKEYAIYLKNLIEKLFKINVSLLENSRRSTIDVVVNSVKFVSFLNRKGLPIGDKLKQGLDIPNWIYEHNEWQRACLRGLLDTDGCTYIDHHRYKDKVYGHIGLAFTSYSPELLVSIAKILQTLGYSPTITTKLRILLRREKEVLRFFSEFKPSNPRHYGKLKTFLEEYRSGYNGTASKAVVAERLP